jgi:hypothetical protein
MLDRDLNNQHLVSLGAFSTTLRFVGIVDGGVGTDEKGKAEQASSPSQETIRTILSSSRVREANLTREFKTVLQLEHGEFALRLGEESALEWRLTYINVKPNEMQAKVAALTEELNSKLAQIFARSLYDEYETLIGWEVYLAWYCDLPTVPEPQDVWYEATSLIGDAFYLLGSSPGAIPLSCKQSSEERPKVQNNHALLAIGLFRLLAGFPKKFSDLATENDAGDLAEGKSVKIYVEHPLATCVKSFEYGVADGKFGNLWGAVG